MRNNEIRKKIYMTDVSDINYSLLTLTNKYNLDSEIVGTVGRLWLDIFYTTEMNVSHIILQRVRVSLDKE